MSAGHAVVVGGTRGLGRVLVDRFRARGYDVSVLSRRPAEAHADDPQIVHHPLDLEEPATWPDVPERVRAARGPIRYLALCQRYRGSGDAWAGEIEVGLNASRALIEGFRPHFTESQDRAVGVVSSVYAGFTGSSQPVGYHVVKAGLNAMVRFYALELGGHGIRINAVMPLTYMKSETRHFYEANEHLMAGYRTFVPLGRMGEADDSADALDFLCSEKASFITGQSLYVDGGVSIVWPEEVAKRFGGL